MISLQDPGITVPGVPLKYPASSQAKEGSSSSRICRGPAGSAVAIANMILRPIDEGAKNVVTKRIHFCIVF